MRRGRRRGAAMSEMVLVIPLIAVIIALLFYMGRLVVRAEHLSVLSRYETWRSVDSAPGPAAIDPSVDNWQLNQTFFAGRADRLEQSIGESEFPVEPYEQFIRASSSISRDAAALADAWIYAPQGLYRYSPGRREGFSLMHDDTLAAWQRIGSVARSEIGNPEARPMLRGSHRIGKDWSYTHAWWACADEWPSGGMDGELGHHEAAVRDAFYESIDSELEAIAGAAVNPADIPHLADRLRALYLAAPVYRGPEVWDPE